MFRFLFAILPFLLTPLQVNPPAGEEGNEKPKPDEKPEEVAFDDRQQAKVNALLAAERKKAEEDTAARLKTKADEDRRKAEADAQRKKDEDAGEFDKVKNTLISERDTAQSDLTAATTELETLRAHVNADIEAATKDDAFKPFLRFDPGADAPIADRLKWLKEAKAGIADLPEPTTTRGAGPNPKPATGHFDKDAALARARQTGKYSI